MHVLLVTLGSHGDVHPFVGLGQRLRERGHEVALATNGHFSPLVRGAGLTMIELGTDADYRTTAAHPDLFHPRRGVEAVMNFVLEGLSRTYETLLAHVRPGETVLGFSTLSFAARLIQEKFGNKGASIHLSPSLFRSEHALPKLPGVHLPPFLPRWFKRAFWREADKRVFRPLLNERMNAFRATIGLPPRDEFVANWWHSPDRVIGLFPEFFAPPQPDWPQQTRLAGFPLYDEQDVSPMSAAARDFLDAGDPPIAFTPGSAMWRGERFFAKAAEACRISGRRGILLSRHTDHIPPRLPVGVIHVDYAPFSQLLPRCAALVHHGGIGTTAQALRAGVPQLIMPMSHDQPDNAHRLKKLGVADAVSPRRFTARRVARRLKRLLASADVRVDCAAAAQQFVGMDGLGAAAALIEELAPGAVAPAGQAAA